MPACFVILNIGRILFALKELGNKIVKVVFEGQTQVREWTNTDGSMEMHVYKKLGTAIVSDHNWAVYQNTAIENNQDNPLGVFTNAELGIN